MRRPPARLAAVALAAVLAFSGFMSLGVWQLERRVWKLDLIARAEARIHAAPAPAPGPADWPLISDARDGYRKLRLEGAFDPAQPTLVQAATAYGSGYWTLAPFRTTQGFVVLVNRGFVPSGTAAAAVTAPQGPTAVTGLLRITERHGAFLRDNEPDRDLWRSRDVAAIAAKRGIEGAAPYFVDADATPNPGGWPAGGLTVVAFRNNHLVYALTWFALAAMVLGAVATLVRHEIRARKSAA